MAQDGIGKITRQEYEVKWADAQITPENIDDWATYPVIDKLYGELDTSFVIWQKTKKGSLKLGFLAIKDLKVSPKQGVSVVLLDRQGNTHEITHAPKKIFGVYLWVPFFCELRFVPKIYDNCTDSRSVRVGIHTKTKSDKSKNCTEGHIYISAWASYHREQPKT